MSSNNKAAGDKMNSSNTEACQNPDYKAYREDPVRESLLHQNKKPDIDVIRGLFPPMTGAAAFGQNIINGNIDRLRTNPVVDTGHPFLDLSIKTGLAFIDATFQGDYPKYGIKDYGDSCHDGFPPTIIAVVDALSAWGLNVRAVQLFRYWLINFVREDGSIAYRGTSLAELGQLLHTASVLETRVGATGWWEDGLPALNRIAESLLALHAEAGKEDGLLAGVPEDDMRSRVGKYFHNNAWVGRGLREWADLLDRLGAKPATGLDTIRNVADKLGGDTLKAIRKTWPDDPTDWWLPAQLERQERPQSLTSNADASYANYRYWPELLSSGLLPDDMANRLVNARLTGGGQFCGMTRFYDRLDDWPLADYLYGLWQLGRKQDFLLSLYGHIAYHQAEGHLTAYEQVTFPPGGEKASYCLPCQLVAARAGRLLV